MNHLKYREWQKPYEEALLEVDREKFKQKLLQAEAAIFLRLQQLANSLDSHAERQAIDDAISGIKVLKTQQLDYPDWKSK
jgi:hypothetical protein